MKTVVQAELPQELGAHGRAFVEEEWAADFDELLAESLGRHLASHSGKLAEAFVREDVKWGLHGRH